MQEHSYIRLPKVCHLSLIDLTALRVVDSCAYTLNHL